MSGSCDRHEPFWEQTFQEHGLGATNEQRLRLASFMTANDFTNLFSLKSATHPESWLGADGFDKRELDDLHQLCRSGASVPASCRALAWRFIVLAGV